MIPLLLGLQLHTEEVDEMCGAADAGSLHAGHAAAAKVNELKRQAICATGERA